jgi:hypothetical protein
MADLILGWNIMIGYNKILAIPIDRCTNLLELYEYLPRSLPLSLICPEMKCGLFGNVLYC